MLLAVGGCSSQSTSQGQPASETDETTAVTEADLAATLVEGRPYEFEVLTETFVDTSRQTPAGASTPAAPERTLETRIYVPDAEGPLPLIVFAHGISGHPDKFTGVFSTWAEAGYVVVAPVFPLTNDRTPGSSLNFTDAENQPADMSFVLDEVLALADSGEGGIIASVDTERIGAAGLSLGGMTTYQAGLSECCRDQRVAAVEIFAGTLPNAGASGPFVASTGVPTLVMHGTDDPWIPYQSGTEAFALLQPPAFLITLEGGRHSEPFEDTASPFDAFVEEVSLSFWDQFLLTSAADADVLFDQVVTFDSATITAASG